MNFKKALEVFGLSNLSEITSLELKKKYHKLAKHKHPDKKGGSNKEFVELRQAYLIISAELEKRKIEKSSGGTSLKELTKEEVLDKYYRDTQELKLKIEDFETSFKDQNEALEKLKSEVENIILEFEEEKEEMKKKLNQEITDLEKEYNPNRIRRLLFFLPKKNQTEFWAKYDNKVRKYSKIDSEADLVFFKKMLSVYGDSLNEISKIVSKIGEED